MAIHWLVDHQWFCVVAFNFSKSIFEEVLKEEEEKRRKKKNEKEKKKKKANIKDKIIVRRNLSRLVCIIFQLN